MHTSVELIHRPALPVCALDASLRDGPKYGHGACDNRGAGHVAPVAATDHFGHPWLGALVWVGRKRMLLSPQARFLVLDMMRGGEGLPGSDHSVAWKTGTSHGFRDAWSVGVRGDYVLVVWLGNFNGRGNNALVARKA